MADRVLVAVEGDKVALAHQEQMWVISANDAARLADDLLDVVDDCDDDDEDEDEDE